MSNPPPPHAPPPPPPPPSVPPAITTFCVTFTDLGGSAPLRREEDAGSLLFAFLVLPFLPGILYYDAIEFLIEVIGVHVGKEKLIWLVEDDRVSASPCSRSRKMSFSKMAVNQKERKKERNSLQEGMWRTSGPQRVYSPIARGWVSIVGGTSNWVRAVLLG